MPPMWLIPAAAAAGQQPRGPSCQVKPSAERTPRWQLLPEQGCFRKAATGAAGHAVARQLESGAAVLQVAADGPEEAGLGEGVGGGHGGVEDRGVGGCREHAGPAHARAVEVVRGQVLEARRGAGDELELHD
ncbi:hypothetical protein PG997_005947 [Apiospora hydei]|uniref:Uncharacterized protein n=1 Tax=Apiospora hydei TaxID=1337664 RepID=A0ABR1WMD1_9PEZI